MATGISLISSERAKKLESGVRSPEKDAKLTSGELLDASSCYFYAAQAGLGLMSHDCASEIIEETWPFMGDPAISDDPVRNLVRAGALIAAEIDRLQAEKPKENTSLTVYSPDSTQEQVAEKDCAPTVGQLLELGFRKTTVLGEDVYDHDCGLLVTPADNHWSFMGLGVTPFGYAELKDHVGKYNSCNKEERELLDVAKGAAMNIAAASLLL